MREVPVEWTIRGEGAGLYAVSIAAVASLTPQGDIETETRVGTILVDARTTIRAEIEGVLDGDRMPDDTRAVVIFATKLDAAVVRAQLESLRIRGLWGESTATLTAEQRLSETRLAPELPAVRPVAPPDSAPLPLGPDFEE